MSPLWLRLTLVAVFAILELRLDIVPDNKQLFLLTIVTAFVIAIYIVDYKHEQAKINITKRSKK